MRIGITQRLFMAILFAVCLAVLCMFITMQWSLESGFSGYVRLLEQTRFEHLAEKLEAAYARNGNWEFLRSKPDNWLRILAETLPVSEAVNAPDVQIESRVGPRLGRGESTLKGTALARFARHFEKRIFLLDAAQAPVFGEADTFGTGQLKTLFHADQAIGYLGMQPPKDSDEVSQLLKHQKIAFAVVGLGIIAAAVILSFLLARRLVRPIGELAAATHRMAAGEFSTRVPVTTADELGRLAGDFNTLALTLESNEKARRQWVADISHELRTPLAVLRGEIEAIQDGVRNFDPESLRSLHQEVLRLGRLVDDLHQLSMSDLGALTYRREQQDLVIVLEQSLEFYRPEFVRKNIDLQADLPVSAPVNLFADQERLRQLFANLLDNSLKYTDEQGVVAVRLAIDADKVLIDFQDSAPRVAESDLPKLFDRLYRVENSRNRATGGSGLGLAICRNIVEAHDGAITASLSPLGGVWIQITFPRARRY